MTDVGGDAEGTDHSCERIARVLHIGNLHGAVRLRHRAADRLAKLQPTQSVALLWRKATASSQPEVRSVWGEGEVDVNLQVKERRHPAVQVLKERQRVVSC